MSSLSTYDIAVPTIQRALEQLVKILQKGEQWAEANNVDKATLLEGNLAPDMKTLPFQIQTVCNTTKLMLSRIGGAENVPVEDTEKTFPELLARINATLDLLKSASREKFSAPDAKLNMKMGPMSVDFTALGYLQRFVLPNFFFHHTTAYLILRHKGVDVGKGIYLGGSDISDV